MMRQRKWYGIGLLVAVVALVLGTGALPAQAKSTNKTVTFGQLTNKNTHRLAAIRQAARQQILKQTHAKGSRVHTDAARLTHEPISQYV